MMVDEVDKKKEIKELMELARKTKKFSEDLAFVRTPVNSFVSAIADLKILRKYLERLDSVGPEVLELLNSVINTMLYSSKLRYDPFSTFLHLLVDMEVKYRWLCEIDYKLRFLEKYDLNDFVELERMFYLKEHYEKEIQKLKEEEMNLWKKLTEIKSMYERYENYISMEHLLNMSKPELLVMSVIGRYKLPFAYTGSGNVGIRPDFVSLDGNVAVEVYDSKFMKPDTYEEERREKLVRKGYKKVIFIEVNRDIYGKGKSWHEHILNLLSNALNE